MEISFFEVNEYEKNYISNALKNHKLKFFSEPLDVPNVSKAKNSDIVCVFIGSKLSSEVLNKLPKLKLVVTRSTGYDHIDIVNCKKREILVANVPSYGPHTVAEHTFALMLSLARKIPQIVQKTRHEDFSLQDIEGFELHGKTLGVIGTGNIGQEVIKRANAFGMHVLGYANHQDVKLERALKFKFTSFNELLKNSDIITLHVPLTKETLHMINAKSISLMKKHVYIINTSRGPIIDTKALISALKSKKIAGVALDVLEGEAEMKNEKVRTKHLQMTRTQESIYRENHALLKDHNVLITPHCAFYTREAIDRILNTTIENMNSYFKSKPINLVK